MDNETPDDKFANVVKDIGDMTTVIEAHIESTIEYQQPDFDYANAVAIEMEDRGWTTEGAERFAMMMLTRILDRIEYGR